MSSKLKATRNAIAQKYARLEEYRARSAIERQVGMSIEYYMASVFRNLLNLPYSTTTITQSLPKDLITCHSTIPPC
jgi:hypothetical protein